MSSPRNGRLVPLNGRKLVEDEFSENFCFYNHSPKLGNPFVFPAHHPLKHSDFLVFVLFPFFFFLF